MSTSTPAGAAPSPETSGERDADLNPAQASRFFDESPVVEHEASTANPTGGAESSAVSGEPSANLNSAQAPQGQSVGLTNPYPVADTAPSAADTDTIEPSSMSAVPGEGAAELGAVEAEEEDTATDNSSTEGVDASEKPQDENCSLETEKGTAGLSRRRNRRQATKRELGLAYGLEGDQARFSQAEVNAKIRERVAEEHETFEKTLKSLKAAHEEQLVMLSESFGEAVAEARSNGKRLAEKEALLDAVTAQLMGLKTELASERESRVAEKQALQKEADNERRIRAAVEGSLVQLEMAYSRLENTERQKRFAGILKMKNDMQALAKEQFSAANKQFNAMKNKLKAVEAEAKQLREAAKEEAEKVEATSGENERLRDQMESLKKELLESSVEAEQRERAYQDKIEVISDEAEARRMEVDTVAFERDTAIKNRQVSQNALARMSIRNTKLKEVNTDLKGKVRELEDFCTQALDELDREKAYSNSLATKLPGNGDK